jgi:hypothetical protein
VLAFYDVASFLALGDALTAPPVASQLSLLWRALDRQRVTLKEVRPLLDSTSLWRALDRQRVTLKEALARPASCTRHHFARRARCSVLDAHWRELPSCVSVRVRMLLCVRCR